MYEDEPTTDLILTKDLPENDNNYDYTWYKNGEVIQFENGMAENGNAY